MVSVTTYLIHRMTLPKNVWSYGGKSSRAGFFCLYYPKDSSECAHPRFRIDVRRSLEIAQRISRLQRNEPQSLNKVSNSGHGAAVFLTDNQYQLRAQVLELGK